MVAKAPVGLYLFHLFGNAASYHLTFTPPCGRIGFESAIRRPSLVTEIARRSAIPSFGEFRGGALVLKAEGEPSSPDETPTDVAATAVAPVSECPVDFGAIGK